MSLGGEWTDVLPTTRTGVVRMDKADRHIYERKALDAWAKHQGHWSGSGKHICDAAEARKIHTKLKRLKFDPLGFGGQGSVQKFEYTHGDWSVCLARKRVVSRRIPVDKLREEAHVLERLDHEHIVKLIGTYAYQPRELNLLMWPAAVCDLSHLLTELEDYRTGDGHPDDVLEKLTALELHDLASVKDIRDPAHAICRHHCPITYLREILGCITEAIAYCHSARVRHLDLKPQNILLSPGRVYLADFGISKDVNGEDHTRIYMESGSTKWLPPERLFPQDPWSMQAADTYSLGLVFLSVATVLYDCRQIDLDGVLEDRNAESRLQMFSNYLETLRQRALLTLLEDDAANTYKPKHIIGLIHKMLHKDPKKRLSASKVGEELASLGGLEQIYHRPCCKYPAHTLTKLMDGKRAQLNEEHRRLVDDNQRMARELAIMNGLDKTYEERLNKERNRHAADRTRLQDRLQQEQEKVKELEERLRRLEQPRRLRPPLGAPTGPRAERSISGGLTMKTTARTAANPSRSPKASMNGRPTSPVNQRRPEPDPRTSTESLTNYALVSRGSGSRLPQPIKPSTPIRSGTPMVTRDSTMTDSTINSLSSSIFSRTSVRTRDSNGSAISPGYVNGNDSGNPNGNGNSVLTGSPGHASKPSYSSKAAAPPPLPPAVRMPVNLENKPDLPPVSPVLSVSALSSPRTVKSELATADNGPYTRRSSMASNSSSNSLIPPVPSMPTAKSWAAVAGTAQAGLTAMVGRRN